MPTIDSIVNVAISATSATPSLPGTDIPAIYGYHNHYNDRIRTYSDPSDLLNDGFTVNDPIYLLALALAEQNPRPSMFKVIRATNAIAQAITFKVTDTQAGDSVGLTLLDAGGVERSIYQTVTAGQTAAQIATALAAIAVPGAVLTVDLVDNTQVDIAISAAGAVWFPSSVQGGNFADVTPTLTPGPDLDAAVLVDANWYGLSTPLMGATNIQALAVWTEANSRLFAYTTDDTIAMTSGSGIGNTLKIAAYNRSYGQFSGTPVDGAAIALMAQRFTADPGSDTWAYKQLAGVPADPLTPNQTAGLDANNLNYYVTIAGVNVTLTGVMASGLYADIQRGLDALKRDIQERVFGLMARNPKVPYTRKGIGMIVAEVSAALQAAVVTGFLSNDVGFQPQVTAPDISQVSPTDKQRRILRGVKFTAIAQGAVQTVFIQGQVNF